VSRLGFGKAGELDDEEMEGELDLEVLDKVHLAGASIRPNAETPERNRSLILS
jgi:hypothetical protein